MELEAVSPPAAAYNVQKTQPGKETMETHANAGRVRVPASLGLEPDEVDCHHCKKRTTTVVKGVPSQSTTVAQIICGVLCVPFCCCTFLIPKWRKWYFDCHHNCSVCGKEIAFVNHNQDKIIPEYVSSQYGH
ncbi:hypothetical protein ANO14919_064700 [Xylariales sp. No.14919]|nr:hypothetical protein ANO14919_064700 [Xylariales sp. No.14919]